MGGMADQKDLDDVDRTILKLLQEDGRTSLTEMAQSLGLSRTAIRYRLASLEQDGILKGFTAILNPLVFESTSYVKILVEIRPQNIHVCMKHFMRSKEVVEVHRLSGDSPLLLTCFFRSTRQRDDFILKRLERLPIESYEVHPVMDISKRTPIEL